MIIVLVEINIEATRKQSKLTYVTNIMNIPAMNTNVIQINMDVQEISYTGGKIVEYFKTTKSSHSKIKR